MDKPKHINTLHTNIRELILEARSTVAKTVNFVSVVQNWEIGRMIVEEEQEGEAKAEYGKYIIKELSEKLTDEFGSGYSIQHLKFCRQFYYIFPIGYALRSQLRITDSQDIKEMHTQLSQSKNSIAYALSNKTHPIYKILSPELSWTHYRSLLKVENLKAREFYIKEAAENDWGNSSIRPPD